MTALGCLLWASIYLYLIAYRVCLCSLTFSHTGFISHLGMYPAHFVLLPFNHHSFSPGHFLSSSPKKSWYRISALSSFPSSLSQTIQFLLLFTVFGPNYLFISLSTTTACCLLFLHMGLWSILIPQVNFRGVGYASGFLFCLVFGHYYMLQT